MKLIFLDIDGTLTQPGENTPPDSAVEAIKKAQARGNKVFLCTGRNPDMLKPLLRYGFDGVAIALIGQLHPLATIVVAIFFAALRTGSTTMQAASGVPTSVSDIIQALVIVFSVAGMALTKLPEFEAFRIRLSDMFRKKKEVQGA